MRRIHVARLLEIDESWVARHIEPSLSRGRLRRYLWPDVLEQTRAFGGACASVQPRAADPFATVDRDELDAMVRELEEGES